jgi:GNAT superfamily N-acetyltransferase
VLARAGASGHTESIMPTLPPIDVRELLDEQDLLAALPLLRQLRPHLSQPTFLEMIARQRREGYQLFGGFAGQSLLVAAGVRETCTLARGLHLFVDDLVTDHPRRGEGFGLAMLRWLAQRAVDRNISRLYLDSRDAAKSFYRQLGFTFLTSVPCWVEARQFIDAD